MANDEWQSIALKAYPPPEVKTKEKKIKNLGSRFPGAGRGVEAQSDGHVEGQKKSSVEVSTGVESAMKNLDTKSHETA